MLMDNITKELDGTCAACKGECRGVQCVVYRLNSIITAHDLEIARLNINDFFEDHGPEQMHLFTEVFG